MTGPSAAGSAHTLHGAPPTHLTVDALTALGLPHATTTRHCPGVGAPGDPERPFQPERFTIRLSPPLDVGRLAFARQVHGARVARAKGPGPVGEADAIVSTHPGQALAVFTADCLPIVLLARDRPALALVHAGWRGTVAGVAEAAVAALAATGADPASLVAAIGPSIGPCCYEVDPPVVEPLLHAFPWAERWLHRRRPADGDRVRGDPPVGERFLLDLWGVNATQLAGAGVPPSAIHTLRRCTSCEGDLFYSYRQGARGRLVTLAALPG